MVRTASKDPSARDKAVQRALEKGYLKADFENGLIINCHGPGGRVLPVGRPVKDRSNDGWRQFDFTLDNKRWTCYVHRAMWIAAHGIPPAPPAGQPPYQVDHIDQNRSNNRLANLRLVSPRLNSDNRTTDFVGEENPSAKLDWRRVQEIRDLYVLGSTPTELARRYKVSKSTIQKIVTNQTWKPDRKVKPGPTDEDIPNGMYTADLPKGRAARSKAIKEYIDAAAESDLALQQEVVANIEPAAVDWDEKPAPQVGVTPYDPEEPFKGVEHSTQHGYEADLTDESWKKGQELLLWKGQGLHKVPELYEKVKATYAATFGNATITARLCGVARSTVLRYAERDNWPVSLEPEVKLAAEKAERTRLERHAAQLYARMVEMLDSLTVEEKDRCMPSKDGLDSFYVERLGPRAQAFKILHDSWMKVMGILQPETYAPLQNQHDRRTTAQLRAAAAGELGGIDGIDRQLADLFAGLARGAAAGAVEGALAHQYAGGSAGGPPQGLVIGEAEVVGDVLEGP